jgi:hypothetical protein
MVTLAARGVRSGSKTEVSAHRLDVCSTPQKQKSLRTVATSAKWAIRRHSFLSENPEQNLLRFGPLQTA